MKIFIYSGESYGTNYFRAQLVRRYLEKQGHQAVHSIHTFPEHAREFDIVYMLRPLFEYCPVDYLHMLQRYGVPIVVDFDDRLDAVPVWSPSSQFFNPWQKEDYYKWIYSSADLVTCASQYGADYITETYHKPTIVIPNAFDIEYKLLRPVRRLMPNDKPTIGWMGGGQHKQDLAAIAGVWDECLNRGYQLRFLGDVPNNIVGKPNTSMTMGTNHVEMYIQIPPLLSFDVALAPLLDIEFNRCKSCLKATEYSWLCGCPAVLQDLHPYSGFQDDGKRVFKVNGYDTDAWMDKIELGLETMRTEGSRYSLDPRYTMNETIKLWIQAFEIAFQNVRGGVPPKGILGNQVVHSGNVETKDGLVSLGVDKS